MMFRIAPAARRALARGARLARLRAVMLVVATAALGGAPAASQSTPAAPRERMDGAAIARDIVGNTLTGLMGRSMRFSEYHAPDGRVLGHNGGEAVSDGCWAIKDDNLCFRYFPGTERREYCWRFERQGESVFVLDARGAVRGLARIERGNPRNWTAPKPWSCDPLVRRMTPRDAGRFASLPARVP